MKPTTEIFEIMAEGKPYIVKVTPYLNGREKLCFRTSMNNSAICVFTWDESLDRFAIMKDARNPFVHPAAEMVIARKLETLSAKKQAA